MNLARDPAQGYVPAVLCVGNGTSAAPEEPAQRLDDHVEQLREHGSYLGVRDLCIGKDNDTGGYESGASRFEIVTHSASYECRDDGALHFAAPPSTRIRWRHGKHAELALAQRPGKYCHYYARRQDLCASSQKTGACSVRTSSGNQERHGQRKCRSGASVDDTRCSIPALHIGPQALIEKYLVMRSIPIYYRSLSDARQVAGTGRYKFSERRLRLKPGSRRPIPTFVGTAPKHGAFGSSQLQEDRENNQTPFSRSRHPATSQATFIPRAVQARRARDDATRAGPGVFRLTSFPVPFQALAWFHCTACPRARSA
jgi:hypothetical protein